MMLLVILFEAVFIIIAQVTVWFIDMRWSNMLPLLTWIMKLTGLTQTSHTCRVFSHSDFKLGRVFGVAGWPCCVLFASSCFPFPPISGRCSLLPSVMRILSKMLFNFRKAADGLCERSGHWKPTIHTCLTSVRGYRVTKWRHLFNITYAGLLGMQDEPVERLTNCLPSEIYSQYSPLIVRTMPVRRVFTIPAGYLQSETPVASHLLFTEI